MTDDPYKVLGVSHTASPEEIKKAYRKKAKEYHPDLHPDDPAAARKMNEVNEAYDMLQNPEKYASRRKQEEHRQEQNTAYRSNSYQGAGGWSSDFGEFSFEDLFGFGFGETQYNTSPHAQKGDPPDLVRAINLVNARRYQDAMTVLSCMTSTYRNDRWYYVNAVAHYGCGDAARAEDMLQRAIQMSPDNKTYRWLLKQYRSRGQTEARQSYTRSSQSPLSVAGKIIIGAAALQFLFMLMQMMFYGMMLPY